MDVRTLQGTDLTVSRLSLGTMTFGGQADEDDAASMLDCALENGINFVDTANVYNAGRSEEILGRLLDGRRDRVILASKVGSMTGATPGEKRLSASAIREAIEASLRRLRTDYVDLYYLHQPDDAVPLEESLEAVEELVREGKVREVGASNYASWQMCRMLWLAKERGYRPVRVTQPMYNPIARGIEQEFLPMCREFSLATIVYNPLAGGLLTGKHRADSARAGTRFSENRMYRDRYWHDENFEAVRELAAVAKAEDRSLVGLSLSWLLHHTAADGLILGASRLEQLEANLRAAAEGPLSAGAVEACDAVWLRLRGVSPKYNR